MEFNEHVLMADFLRDNPGLTETTARILVRKIFYTKASRKIGGYEAVHYFKQLLEFGSEPDQAYLRIRDMIWPAETLRKEHRTYILTRLGWDASEILRFLFEDYEDRNIDINLIFEAYRHVINSNNWINNWNWPNAGLGDDEFDERLNMCRNEVERRILRSISTHIPSSRHRGRWEGA